MEFHGVVEAVPGAGLVGDWRVSHHTIHVRAATRIVHPGLARPGARARVVGRWLRDGSIRASRVVLRG